MKTSERGVKYDTDNHHSSLHYHAPNGAVVTMRSDGRGIESALVASHLSTSSSKSSGQRTPEQNLGIDIPGQVLARSIVQDLQRGAPLAEIADRTGAFRIGREGERWSYTRNAQGHPAMSDLPEHLLFEAQKNLLELCEREPVVGMEEGAESLLELGDRMRDRSGKILLQAGTPMVGDPTGMKVNDAGEYKVYVPKMLLLNKVNFILTHNAPNDVRRALTQLAHNYGFSSYEEFVYETDAAPFPFAASHGSHALPTLTDGVPLDIAIAAGDMSNSGYGTIAEIMCMTNPIIMEHNFGTRDARTYFRGGNVSTYDAPHVFTAERYYQNVRDGILSGVSTSQGRTGYVIMHEGRVVPMMYGPQRLRLEGSRQRVRTARLERTGSSSADDASVTSADAMTMSLNLTALEAVAHGVHPVDYYGTETVRDWHGSRIANDYNHRVGSSRLARTRRDSEALLARASHVYRRNPELVVAFRLAQGGIDRAFTDSGARDLAEASRNPMFGNPADVIDRMHRRGASVREIFDQQIEYQAAVERALSSLPVSAKVARQI